MAACSSWATGGVATQSVRRPAWCRARLRGVERAADRPEVGVDHAGQDGEVDRHRVRGVQRHDRVRDLGDLVQTGRRQQEVPAREPRASLRDGDRPHAPEVRGRADGGRSAGTPATAVPLAVEGSGSRDQLVGTTSSAAASRTHEPQMRALRPASRRPAWASRLPQKEHASIFRRRRTSRGRANVVMFKCRTPVHHNSCGADPGHRRSNPVERWAAGEPRFVGLLTSQTDVPLPT